MVQYMIKRKEFYNFTSKMIRKILFVILQYMFLRKV